MSCTLDNVRLGPALFRGFILVWIVALLASGVEAQLIRGFISGTVTDTQGGVIPNVQITITNPATNLSQTTITNRLGVYRFVAVEPGSYSVEFRLPGFESRRYDDVRVGTSHEVLINSTLSPAAANTEILVTAPIGADLMKASPTIERTLSQRIIAEIPTTPSRDITQLARLAPTINVAPESSELSANGQRARNNNFTIDGTENNDPTITKASILVPPEAIQEMQIQTSAYSAEFGRNTGAQISIITRGGTNVFHGDVWEFYRGNWMEPLSLSNKRAQLKETPRFVNNQFGAGVGGPIAEDRTFFFGMFQGNLLRQAPDADNATPANVPTPAGYAALQNVPLRAGQPTASRQAALQALAFLPEIHSSVSSYDNIRNVTVNGVPIEVGTIIMPIAQPSNLWYSAARVDHQLTDEDRLSYRFHLDSRDRPDFVGNLAFGRLWSANEQVLGQNHAFSYTRTLSSTLINEARLAYTRRFLDFPERDPVSSTVGITGHFTVGGLAAFPQARLDQVYQLQNVATSIHGKHSLKFGIDLKRITLFNRSGNNSKGTWVFSSLESFMNNSAQTLTQAVNEATFNSKYWSQNYFFQDDFKATRDLTLNFGLRYETAGVPLGMFGATQPEAQATGVPGPARRDKNNWAPRFGFAYSPSNPSGVWETLLGRGQSSIRGGFGMAYDVVFSNILIAMASNWPRVVTQQLTDLLDVFPALAPRQATVPPFNPMNVFVNAPEDMQNPTTHFWSLSLQRQFGTGYVVELGYTGNRSYHMIRQSQGNPPILTPEQAATVIAGGSIPSAQARRLNPGGETAHSSKPQGRANIMPGIFGSIRNCPAAFWWAPTTRGAQTSAIPRKHLPQTGSRCRHPRFRKIS